MAIYHFTINAIGRSQGRSAPAAAAYRAAAKIVNERTGQVNDYTKKDGVISSHLVLPSDAPSWANDRAKLWNAVEASETRKNSTVAREFLIALPSELNAQQREQFALDFAREISKRHTIAVDVCIHAPSKHGSDKNHHAHLLMTTRRLTADGFTEKSRELDVKTSGEVEFWRERFADMTNERLAYYGHESRISHLSLKAQGIDREPTKHLGPAATEYERRTGLKSRIREDFERAAQPEKGNDDELTPAKTHAPKTTPIEEFAHFAMSAHNIRIDPNNIKPVGQLTHVPMSDYSAGATMAFLKDENGVDFVVYNVAGRDYKWTQGQEPENPETSQISPFRASQSMSPQEQEPPQIDRSNDYDPNPF